MAAGTKVPIVLFARFTTLQGAATYATTPVDTLGFGEFAITFHRGPVSGTGPGFSFQMQESAELDGWQNLGSAVLDTGLVLPATASQTVTPTRRFVRCTATITGTDNPGCTLWAVGYVERTIR